MVPSEWILLLTTVLFTLVVCSHEKSIKTDPECRYEVSEKSSCKDRMRDVKLQLVGNVEGCKTDRTIEEACYMIRKTHPHSRNGRRRQRHRHRQRLLGNDGGKTVERDDTMVDSRGRGIPREEADVYNEKLISSMAAAVGENMREDGHARKKRSADVEYVKKAADAVDGLDTVIDEAEVPEKVGQGNGLRKTEHVGYSADFNDGTEDSPEYQDDKETDLDREGDDDNNRSDEGPPYADDLPTIVGPGIDGHDGADGEVEEEEEDDNYYGRYLNDEDEDDDVRKHGMAYDHFEDGMVDDLHDDEMGSPDETDDVGDDNGDDPDEGAYIDDELDRNHVEDKDDEAMQNDNVAHHTNVSQVRKE